MSNIFYSPETYTGQDGKQRGKRDALQAGKYRARLQRVWGM